jgi:hypothetical protein
MNLLEAVSKLRLHPEYANLQKYAEFYQKKWYIIPGNKQTMYTKILRATNRYKMIILANPLRMLQKIS